MDSKSVAFSIQFRKATQLPIFCAGLILVLVLVLAFAPSSFGQDRPDPRNPDRRDYDDRSGSNGVSAGGNWMQYRSEDRMTAEKLSRFELQANDSRDGDDRDGDGRAQVVLYCSDGRLKLADFRPNLRLSRPNWGGFWGQPQMRVRVRADDSHDDHSWNWVNGHFLSMDKGTTRELIGAHIFKVEIPGPRGPEIAEFSPAGLDLARVKQDCDLKPKRPSRD